MSETAPDLRHFGSPDDPTPCVKCGSASGWNGPTYSYVPCFNGRELEQLAFTCRTCGYQRTKPTKDAKPSQEPMYIFPPPGFELRRIPEAPWWAFWR